MQGDIVQQGVELLIYGMGTVVLFLSLLVVATTGMSRLLTRYFPEAEIEVASGPRGVGGGDNTDVDPAVLAAITAAIHRHRQTRR